AGRSASVTGSGGMATKLIAARIAMAAGCHMCIAAGHHAHPLRRIEKEARGTWFVPATTPRSARRQWIAGSLRPAGVLKVDAGARRALQAGKSLLPAGVVAVCGRFERGDTVSVQDEAGVEIARGLVAFGDADATRLIGKKSSQIEAVLGFRGRSEMVHRDDLVLMHSGDEH
ncbi:MAG: glutamate 5-kinase, partial [Steroidobacteraceae bacterium]|nr:glutamate 5-kinase [Steroidobacteraceae bacterium]